MYTNTRPATLKNRDPVAVAYSIFPFALCLTTMGSILGNNSLVKSNHCLVTYCRIA